MAKQERKHHIRKSPLSGYDIETHMDVWGINDYIDKFKCSMFGRPCQQAYTAFFVWEKLLGPLAFSRFIEVGTGRGNASIFFMLHCMQKDAAFYTFDQIPKRAANNSPLKEALNLKGCAIIGDVYGPDISQSLMELCYKPGLTVLFLDGGDKPHEFQLFVPALKKGDIVAIHDWGRCIKTEWVQHVIDHRGLASKLLADNTELNTATRMWEVTK